MEILGEEEEKEDFLDDLIDLFLWRFVFVSGIGFIGEF